MSYPQSLWRQSKYTINARRCSCASARNKAAKGGLKFVEDKPVSVLDRPNFGPIQESDCATFPAVSDTRCSTHLSDQLSQILPELTIIEGLQQVTMKPDESSSPSLFTFCSQFGAIHRDCLFIVPHEPASPVEEPSRGPRLGVVRGSFYPQV